VPIPRCAPLLALLLSPAPLRSARFWLGGLLGPLHGLLLFCATLVPLGPFGLRRLFRRGRLFLRQLEYRDLHPSQLLDVGNRLLVLRCDESKGAPLCSGATGAADAVHVVIGGPGRVEVAHVTDAFDFET